MAEIILSPLMDAAIGYLISTIQDEVHLVWGVKQELEDLNSTLSAINGVLADAEEKQVKEMGVRDWLKKLKHVAYEVDNVLDEYAIEALRRQVEQTTESSNFQVSDLLSCVSDILSCVCFKRVVFRHSIGNKIRNINTRLNKITEERSKFHLREGVMERKKVEIIETYSFVDQKTVLGREIEKQRIIDMLIASTSSSSSNGDDVFVIPIVGLGGMGKTTLAQFIYNDDKVEKHFHLRSWVTVSVDFDIKRFIRAIIKSDNTLETLESLQGKLREMLHGKRFLLVLDDVWNEIPDEWEKLMNLLRGGANGSRILVTTRSQNVLSVMGAKSHIDLKGLADSDCLQLFLQRAFPGNEVEAHPKLLKIGTDIVKKCKGVPLAAKTLGSMLTKKSADKEWEPKEWERVRDSEIWGLPEAKNTILNALRISYNHLPSHLKQCFAYCSLYPKDYEIYPEKLIKVWMAQGYIQLPSKEENSKQVEDIGMDYFNDLLWRSFFQDVELDSHGNIESCKMHDLMHDLAQAIAKEECFMIKVGKSSSKEEVKQQQEAYHLSLDCYDGAEASTSIPSQLYRCSNIRTLMLDGRVIIHDNLFSSLKCLRVLDLSGSRIGKLPDSIENLKHLRYLGLGQANIKRLPETICSLCNLQTLDLMFCSGLCELPKGLKKMVSLRHLQLPPWNELKWMPSGMGRLTSLQTLSQYKVGENTSKNSGGLGELQDLNLLRGRLEICKLENAKKNDAYKANLKNKQHLDLLALYWGSPLPRTINVEEEEEEEGILEGLQPHPNLKSLIIANYAGAKFPSWIAAANSLPNLLWLSLNDFHNDKLTSLPNGLLQNLTALQHLTLEQLAYVASLPESVESLSALTYLRIEDCPRLESLPEGLKRLSKLESVVIQGCPLLIERCNEGGEDWHKIAHVLTRIIV